MKDAMKRTRSLKPIGLNTDSILVRLEFVRNAGSCNACSGERVKKAYDNDEVITEVHVRGLSFRLCDYHKKEMIKKLKNGNRV